MATVTTVISDLTYLFKENVSYLNQENWQDYFNSVIPSGFVNHACSYSNATQKLTINTLKGISKGLSVDVDGDDFELQIGESSLFFIALDLQDNKVKLYQTKDISGNVVAKIREYISSNMAGLDAYIDHQVFGVGDRDLHTSYLPIAYGYRNSTLNTTYADLGKLITSSGQSFYYQIVAQNSGTVPTQPDCGQISQYGLAQIYGGHNYDITIKSSFVPTEYLLYPVPACSMEPANVRVKNDSGGQITIKVPKQSAYSYFEYVNDGLWVDDGQANGYISFLLPDDGDVIITFTQVNQYSTEASSVISSHSIYMISQNVKNEDTGDSYTKAEANSLFALKSTTEAALATKADASDVAAKAPLASPAFTGTPTVPTPYSSDDSTKIANTEWVKNQGYAPLNSPAFTGQPTAPTPSASDDSTKIATTAFVKGGFAPIASPAFTGNPTAPTQSASDDSTKLATTAFVKDVVEDYAPLASPAFSGAPTAPTQVSSDESTKIANTSWVKGQLGSYATLASPALTGAPTAPTQEVSDDSTKIATTAFVKDAIEEANAGLAPLASPAFTGTPTAPAPSVDDISDKIATTYFVSLVLENYAPLASPALTGTPTAPTPDTSDDSTKIATTKFVRDVILQRQASDIYVDLTNGNDTTGTGAQSSPFKTIQKAIDYVSPGAGQVAIHIAPGVYDETLTITGKNIRLIGTLNTEIRISSNDSVYPAITVNHGGNLEIVGVFSIYGQNSGLSIRDNSAACYKIISSDDKLNIRAQGTTQNVVHRCIAVSHGGKFTADGEVDVYIYPNSVVSHGIYAAYGGFVSVNKLVADIYSNDVALYNDKSLTIVGELTGTYGTAYSNTNGFSKIGNVN